MAITNATLAQQISDLISYWDGFNQEYQEWLGGSVGGGPNLDGQYPLTDYTGNTDLVDCPAQLANGVNGSVASAQAAQAAAEAAQALAETAQTAAELAETNADAAETAAVAAKDTAEAAQAAAESARSTAIAQAAVATAKAILTAADAISTAADVVLTAADVVLCDAAAAAAAASAIAAATFDPANFYLRTALDGGQLNTLYYTETEIDATFANYTLTSGLSISNWNTAYGWGDHSSAGYLTSVTSLAHGTTVLNSASSSQLYFNNAADALLWRIGCSGDGTDDFIVYDSIAALTRLTLDDTSGDLTVHQGLNVTGAINLVGGGELGSTAFGGVSIHREHATSWPALSFSNNGGIKGYAGFEDDGTFILYDSAASQIPFQVDDNGYMTADRGEFTSLGYNADPGTDDLYIGGYGLMGNRAGSIYFTNYHASGSIILGNNGTHGVSPIATLSSALLAVTGAITATTSITGASDYISGRSRRAYGIDGGYSVAGGGGAFGATIWSIGTSYKGATAGSNSANTSVYGVRWLRSAHANVDAAVGEGMHLYLNGILNSGIGSAGVKAIKGTFSGAVTGSTFNGLAVNTTTVNNVANQIARTNASGYFMAGWINTLSGVASGTITRVQCSQDAYLRYLTPANFKSTLGILNNVSSGYTGGGKVTVASSAPGSPTQGDIWFDTT